MIAQAFLQDKAAMIYVTLWCTAMGFVLRVHRRPKFWRYAVSWLVMAVCADLASMGSTDYWSRIIAGLISVILFFWNCAELTLPQAAYGAAWTNVVHQLTCEIWALLVYYFCGGQSDSPGGLLIGVLCQVVVFAANYMTLARWLPKDGAYRVGPRQLSLTVLMVVVFEFLFLFMLDEGRLNDPVFLLGVIPAQFYCAFMLYFQHTLFQKSALKNEVELMNQLYYKQKAQYELSREAVELINRKCHELKCQVAAMRESLLTQQQAEQLDELERSIRVYDASVQTGNPVLDTLLTEKCLLCEGEGITINCVADGSRLQFIDPVDLYAILGDAIDAAMRDVRRFGQAGRRIIDLLVCNQINLLVMQLSAPVWQDLPKDEDRELKLKSIRRTVAKYNGHVRARAENGTLTLKIVIPLENAE